MVSFKMRVARDKVRTKARALEDTHSLRGEHSGEGEKKGKLR